MVWRSVIGGVMAAGAMALASCVSTPPSDIVVITDARIIDGLGGAPMDDGVILIQDDRILAVGGADEISVPADAEIIDVDGKTVMPGLVDVHVHFDILGHANYGHWFGTYEDRMRSDIMPSAAQAMLRAGVTSVRDLGADVDNIFWLRDEIEAGRLPGPRTFIAGPFLRKTPTSFVSTDYVDTWVIESPEVGREKVRRLIDMGVDVIKTQDEALSKAELAAIYDEAHKGGLRVASHIYAADAVETALEAGLGPYDTIEHIGVNQDQNYNQNVVSLIVENRVAMAPTIIALEGVKMIINDPALLEDEAWRRDIPAEDLYADIQRSYRETDLSQHAIFIRSEADRMGRFSKLKHLYDNGAIFAISSDSGTRGNPHHNAMWREMVLTEQVTGMPRMGVIVAATAVNAKILGAEDEIGTLEPGKYADIIIIDGDPLEDLAAMSQIVAVYKGGALVE
ncbi:MAG: amidohydrolase family protein [Hyphomonadaceae bacterium]|nr:amidohydrolase family protein [Hyphomonadaceae bacterium]